MPISKSYDASALTHYSEAKDRELEVSLRYLLKARQWRHSSLPQSSGGRGREKQRTRA